MFSVVFVCQSLCSQGDSLYRAPPPQIPEPQACLCTAPSPLKATAPVLPLYSPPQRPQPQSSLCTGPHTPVQDPAPSRHPPPTRTCSTWLNLDLAIQVLDHYEAWTVGKRAAGIRLKCILIFKCSHVTQHLICR